MTFFTESVVGIFARQSVRQGYKAEGTIRHPYSQLKADTGDNRCNRHTKAFGLAATNTDKTQRPASTLQHCEALIGSVWIS